MFVKDNNAKLGSSPKLNRGENQENVQAQLESNGTAPAVNDDHNQGQEPSTSGGSKIATSQVGGSSVGFKRPRNVEDDDSPNTNEEGGAAKIPKLESGKQTDEVMGQTEKENDPMNGGVAQQKRNEGSTPSQPKQEDVIESDESDVTDNDNEVASSSSQEQSEDNTGSDSSSGEMHSGELTAEVMGNGDVAQQSDQEDVIESDDSEDTDDREASTSSQEQSEDTDSSSGQLQGGELTYEVMKKNAINGSVAQQKVEGSTPSQPEQEYESEDSDDTDGNIPSSSSSEEQSEETNSGSASDQ